MIQTLKTDENGYAKSKPLIVSSVYTLKETWAPANILVDFDDQTIALCLGNINKQIVIQRRSRLKAKMKKAIFND